MNTERLESVSLTRNSKLRRKTAGARRRVAEFIHEHIPGLDANGLSLIGTGGVLFGATIATAMQEDIRKDPKKAALPLGIITFFSLLDAVDGPLARLLAEKYPDMADTSKGQLFDVLNDRGQELIMALLRAYAAYKRGDRLGMAAALATGATNPLPSEARAVAESLGFRVAEIRKDPLEVLGNRMGRGVVSTVSTAIPEVGPVPIQPLLDIATTISNVVSATSRVQTIFDKRNEPPELSAQIRKEGAGRAKVLAGVAAAAAGASIVAYSRFRK